jgi:outer membrane protein insertion porin family
LCISAFLITLAAPSAHSGGMASRMAALDASRVALEAEVKPFSGCVVDEIIVEGNTHTKRQTIIREMATKEGEHLDEDIVYRDHSYLRGLGFFSEVDVEIVETLPGHCSVVVSVSERPGLFMKYPLPSVNYDFVKGVSYGVRWKIKNFQGTGQELFAGFEKRRGHEHGGSISWSLPWIGQYRMRLNLQGFSHTRLTVPDKADFIKERHGGGVMLGFPLTRSLLRQVWIMPELMLENRCTRLSAAGPPNSDGDYFRQLLLVTGLSLTYDSRDNLISPMSGVFAGATVRRYTSIEGMEQQYSLMSLTANFYMPVSRLGTFIIAFRGDNRDGALPWFYKMGMGGMDDLRGYRADDARGNSRLLTTVQVRRNFFGPAAWDIPLVGKFDLSLNAVAFVDNGALMDSLNLVSHTRFHSTAGFGIEILSPIQDIARLEVAFSESGTPMYYFTTGSRF